MDSRAQDNRSDRPQLTFNRIPKFANSLADDLRAAMRASIGERPPGIVRIIGNDEDHPETEETLP